MKSWVLRYTTKRFQVIGPFDDKMSAAKWAKDLENNPNDDPRWAIIETDNILGMAADAIISPAQAGKS